MDYDSPNRSSFDVHGVEVLNYQARHWCCSMWVELFSSAFFTIYVALCQISETAAFVVGPRNEVQLTPWPTRAITLDSSSTTEALNTTTNVETGTLRSPEVVLKPIRSTTVARNLPYESTLAALQAYHEQHGHLVMPWRYVVRSNQTTYPPEWVGYDLPLTVYHMEWWQDHVRNRPQRVHDLNSLGFVWERLQPKWNIVMEAFVTYHSLYGNIRVHDGFVVPTNDTTWPKATWRIPLGKTVNRIRQRNDFLLNPANSYERRQQLDRMGFIWNCHDESFWKFYIALRRYRLLYSQQQATLCVPTDYCVPSNTTDWPPELWGFPLGLRCRDVVHYNHYQINKDPHRRKLLTDLGLQRSTYRNWLRISHAAALYSRLHNRTLHVPLSFCVPETWPTPALWGLPLGARLQKIRTEGAYLKGPEGPARRRQLEALGFVWDVDSAKFALYCQAVRCYKDMYGQERDIPVRFTVPTGDAAWPPELWLYELGRKTNQIRTQQQFIKDRPDRRDDLIRLGVRLNRLRSGKQKSRKKQA